MFERWNLGGAGLVAVSLNRGNEERFDFANVAALAQHSGLLNAVGRDR